MKNILIIDRANNATFSDQDMEVSEDFHERVGDERASAVLTPIWERPILKRDAYGIHGTLYYDWQDKKYCLPKSKREVDWDDNSINEAQRKLFRLARHSR